MVGGEVGAGKSTSLRAAAARFIPSLYCVIPIVATSGSLMELLRQICIRAALTIDEAHILRLDVFAQLHTLAHVDYDSRNLLPIVLSGQTALIDKLLCHSSRPFASCVVGVSTCRHTSFITSRSRAGREGFSPTMPRQHCIRAPAAS